MRFYRYSSLQFCVIDLPLIQSSRHLSRACNVPFLPQQSWWWCTTTMHWPSLLVYLLCDLTRREGGHADLLFGTIDGGINLRRRFSQCKWRRHNNRNNVFFSVCLFYLNLFLRMRIYYPVWFEKKSKTLLFTKKKRNGICGQCLRGFFLADGVIPLSNSDVLIIRDVLA